MTTPKCHPAEPHYALGLCRRCYNRGSRERAAKRAGRQILCAVCDAYFEPYHGKSIHCSPACRNVSIGWGQIERRGSRPEDEEIYATRDREFAERLARLAVERGCRRVHPKASGGQLDTYAYFSAWHRGNGLYLVRVRWPADEEGEVAA